MTELFAPPRDEAILAAWNNGSLAEMVEEILAAVVGQPLADMGRAGDLAWIGFGPEVLAPAVRDPDRRIALHRLHVQCPFRLDGPRGPIAAAHDMYADPGKPDDTSEDFEWDAQGANLFDRRMAAFWADHAAAQLVCQAVTADRAGGFALALDRGYSIRAFPQTSSIREHWRYFRAGEDSGHFVVLPEP
jgi:hypothetical protein